MPLECRYDYSNSGICTRPPVSTLFPYTTLFRSRLREPLPGLRTQLRLEDRRALRGRGGGAVGPCGGIGQDRQDRSEEHTSELQSRGQLVCRLLLEKKKQKHSMDNA